MAEETKEYLDYEGLSEYHKKSEELFQDLTIEEIEEAFNELDESDPSYSAFYDVIAKAKEANAKTDEAISKAETAATNADEATSKADEATDRANKAAEKLETVNDFTTGENLLRGTRDFRLGTESIVLNGSQCTVDGFILRVNSQYVSFTKDYEGFTIANLYNSGASTTTNTDVNSSLIKVEKLGVYTVSLEIMIDNYQDWNLKVGEVAVARTVNDSYSTINRAARTFNSLGITNPESNKWYQVSFKIEVTEKATWLELILRATGNASLHYRKLNVQYGSINNPIYSVAPADLSLEPVNDITTGINLVKGSRDFRNATIFGKNSPHGSDYYDGFGFTNKSTDGKHVFEFLRDEQGFMTVHMACSGLTADDEQYVESNTFEITRDKTYTYYCDFLVDDIAALDNEACCRAYGIVKGSSNWLSLALFNLTDVVVGGKIENKVWCRAVFQFTPTNVDIVMVRFTLRRNGSVYVRKMGVCEGNIINPEWSMNPFDIPIINVETDGFIYRGLPKVNDFDNIVIQGNYIINKGADYYKNDPHATHGYGQLLVFTAATYVIQIRISNSSDVNLRPQWRASAQLGAVWSNWSPFSAS